VQLIFHNKELKCFYPGTWMRRRETREILRAAGSDEWQQLSTFASGKRAQRGSLPLSATAEVCTAVQR